MKLKQSLLSLGLLVVGALPAQEAWSPDNGDGTFTNPILWGDWPDPDVIRVGGDFYMVSTSMHYLPGSPLLHSKDLVNWEMVGYPVQRYDDDERYDMKGGQLYLNGSWANSLRYHNGKFYVAFCTPYGWGTEKGHFHVCEAEKPEGPWQITRFPEYLYDPGLFFDDDGRVYVVHGQGTLRLTELNADARSVKKGGVDCVIWQGGVDNMKKEGKNAGMEGSHVYKVNGKYYLLCAAGGTQGWQMCLRSDKIEGPYEAKAIVTDDRSYPDNGLHQGGMVQLKNGDWWFIIMQDRGPIGRSTHLLPVTWKDGWPILGIDGRDAVTYKKPDVGRSYPVRVPDTSDEFSGKSLGLQWQWNHNPDNTRWSLMERRGFMRLKAGLASNLVEARNTLTQRVQGPVSTGTVELDFSGMKETNVAGFGIIERPYAYLAVEKVGGKHRLIMVHDMDSVQTLVDNLEGNNVWLRASVTDKDFSARFSYSTDGDTFVPVDTVLNMGLGWPWTANRFALINFTRTTAGIDGVADFNWFRFYNK